VFLIVIVSIMLTMSRREGADGGASRDIVGGHDVMGMFTFGFSRDPEKKKLASLKTY
jgi:hypothetical protein